MRRFDNEGSRFSNRVLLTHAAAGLPDGHHALAEALHACLAAAAISEDLKG